MGEPVRAAAAMAVGALLLGGCASSHDTSPTAPPIDGGTAVCDEPSLSAVIRDEVDQTYPGATFVSLEDYECIDGWAYARAQVDTSGVVVPTAFFLRAEGQLWIPVSLEEICSAPPGDPAIPATIYELACETTD